MNTWLTSEDRRSTGGAVRPRADGTFGDAAWNRPTLLGERTASIGTEPQTMSSPASDRAGSDGGSRSALHADFARTAVNPPTIAVQASGGDQPAEESGFALGGEAAGGGAAGAAALGGNASTMSTSDLSAAEWKNYGEFKWWIKWVTDGTTGWIVQRIDNTYSGSLADGTAITNATVGVEPSYYEAWEVAANGTITGSLGATGNRDRWERPAQANGSNGSFSMTGTVYWTASDPAASGFTSGGVANAGTLLSKKTAPAGLSGALLSREAHGMWTSTGAQMLPGCWKK